MTEIERYEFIQAALRADNLLLVSSEEGGLPLEGRALGRFSELVHWSEGEVRRRFKYYSLSSYTSGTNLAAMSGRLREALRAKGGLWVIVALDLDVAMALWGTHKFFLPRFVGGNRLGQEYCVVVPHPGNSEWWASPTNRDEGEKFMRLMFGEPQRTSSEEVSRYGTRARK